MATADSHGMDMGKSTQHAFVMLGTETLFLCHLTMFHMTEHMYQFVAEVKLSREAEEYFNRKRRDNPNKTYFLANSENDKLLIPDLNTGSQPSFAAWVYEGIPKKDRYKEWPWNGIEPIIKQNLIVTVERVVYFRRFDFDLKYPKHLTYFVFGKGAEAHMTNYQTKEPDFDHVLSLSEVPGWLPATRLEAGVHVSLQDFPVIGEKGAFHCSDPLTKPEYEVQYGGQEGTYPIREPIEEGTIKIGKSWWCSTKVVNMHDPCAKGGG